MFHLRDGFHFERVDHPGTPEHGSVHIRYAVPVVPGQGHEVAVIAETTVPENEWASLLAAMCSSGTNPDGNTYLIARAFHAGPPGSFFTALAEPDEAYSAPPDFRDAPDMEI
jgi:hypothetical protein